jgi:glycosyltransferase involved in cell wall biosynthesis
MIGGFAKGAAVAQSTTTILQIIPQLDTGGAELSTIEITQAVVRAGGRMLVLSEGGRLASEVTRLGGELILFPAATKNPAAIYANSRRIAALVAREKIDLLHARSRAPAWSALMAARRAGKPFVTTYHGAYGSIGRIKTAYNSVMARGDAVIANSEFTANLIRARHHTPPERLSVIHRGVDLAQFDPAAVTAARTEALRRAWGLDSQQRVILHAARLTGWKGQRVLIDAAALLKAQGSLSDCVIILAGDAQGRDGYVEELHSRIASAGLGDQVRLVGHCADIAAAYQLAFVTVVPSTEPEAFGRAAAEALAMGCPIVASDHGAPPEILRMGEDRATNSPGLAGGPGRPGRPGRLGRLTAPGHAQDLASALAGVLALSPDDREQIRAEGRAHVARHFSIARMQRATLEVYDRLLGTRLAARFEAATTGSYGADD